jgi:hypothetical protein
VRRGWYNTDGGLQFVVSVGTGPDVELELLRVGPESKNSEYDFTTNRVVEHKIAPEVTVLAKVVMTRGDAEEVGCLLYSLAMDGRPIEKVSWGAAFRKSLTMWWDRRLGFK